jgi:hypothetical protein
MFIQFEKISFNAKWVASKSFTEFKEHEKHHGLSEAKMKEVHNLCTEAMKPKEKAEKPAPPAK